MVMPSNLLLSVPVFMSPHIDTLKVNSLCVSSSLSSIFTTFGSSLMNRKNNKGPRIDPCGTPNGMGKLLIQPELFGNTPSCNS